MRDTEHIPRCMPRSQLLFHMEGLAPDGGIKLGVTGKEGLQRT